MTVLHKCRLCNAEDWQNVITWIFPMHANFIFHVFYAVISFQMFVTMCPSNEKLLGSCYVPKICKAMRYVDCGIPEISRL